MYFVFSEYYICEFSGTNTRAVHGSEYGAMLNSDNGGFNCCCSSMRCSFVLDSALGSHRRKLLLMLLNVAESVTSNACAAT